MLERIKQAQLSGRILPDMVVDYESVKIENPLDVIVALIPEIKNLITDSTIAYRVKANGVNYSVDISHIEDFEPDYYIVRISTHDDTLCFVYELYERVFKGVISGTAYCSNKPYTFGDDIEYTLGNLYHFSDYGLKEINGARMHGVTDVMVLPVKTNQASKEAK